MSHVLPDPPRGVRMLTNEQASLLNARVPGAASRTPANCVTCRGKRTFQWFAPGARTEVVSYECNCNAQYLLYRSLLNAGIPLNYQRLGWADYTHLSDTALESLGSFLSARDRFLDAGFGLVLHGSRGNGKSLMANLLIKEMVGEGVPCYSTTFADMVDAFAGGWKDPAQERWFNQTVRNARVLYIDDVGREQRDRQRDAALDDETRKARATADNRPGSMKETLLEAVIRHRVGNCLPTFISTNFTPEQITLGYGGHTMSLLGERSLFVEVTGTDRRTDMRERETDYVLRGLARPIVIDSVGAPQ